MTTPQLMSIGLLIGMMGLFLWGRFRYDVTAIIALLAGLSLGLVKPKAAFTGFSDDIVIIVGSALVISSAMQRSGLIESALDTGAARDTRPVATRGADYGSRGIVRARKERRCLGYADAGSRADGEEIGH